MCNPLDPSCEIARAEEDPRFAPWSMGMSLSVKSLNNMLQLMPLILAIYVNGKTFDIDAGYHGQYGTYVLNSIEVKDINTFKKKEISIQCNLENQRLRQYWDGDRSSEFFPNDFIETESDCQDSSVTLKIEDI